MVLYLKSGPSFSTNRDFDESSCQTLCESREGRMPICQSKRSEGGPGARLNNLETQGQHNEVGRQHLLNKNFIGINFQIHVVPSHSTLDQQKYIWHGMVKCT